MENTKAETYREFVRRLTSDNFSASNVPLAVLLGELSWGVTIAEDLDEVKSALFYGDDLDLSDAKGLDPNDADASALLDAGIDPKLFHAILGLFTEAGEMLDAIEEAVALDKQVDVLNLIEERGDIEFFAEMFDEALNLTRSDVRNVNTAKLNARYADGEFSVEDALQRDVTIEREVMTNANEQ